MPGQALLFQQFKAPRISRQLAHECHRVVSPTHRPLLPPRRNPWFSLKNPNDNLVNRTHDPSACSAVSKLTAPPRALVR